MSTKVKKSDDVFDYSVIKDEDKRSRMVYREGAIKQALLKTAMSYLDECENFALAHDDFANDSLFVEWSKACFGLSRTAAHERVSVWRAFGFRPESGRLIPSVLAKLSRKLVPDKARLEAVKLAGKGRAISLDLAEQIIDEYTVESGESEAEKPLSVPPPAEDYESTDPVPKPDVTDPSPAEDTASADSGSFETPEGEVLFARKKYAVDEWRDLRAELKRHAEALSRGLSDFNRIKSFSKHELLVTDCTEIIKELQKIK